MIRRSFSRIRQPGVLGAAVILEYLSTRVLTFDFRFVYRYICFGNFVKYTSIAPGVLWGIVCVVLVSYTWYLGMKYEYIIVFFPLPVFVDRFDPGRFNMSRCGELLFGDLSLIHI